MPHFLFPFFLCQIGCANRRVTIQAAVPWIAGWRGEEHHAANIGLLFEGDPSFFFWFHQWHIVVFVAKTSLMFFFTLMWLCQKWLHEGSSMFFFNVLAFSTIDGNVQEENANQTGGMGSCPMMARFFSHRRNGQRVHQVSKVLSHRFSRRFIRIQQEISWT
jgi:hypothetical protein